MWCYSYTIFQKCIIREIKSFMLKDISIRACENACSWFSGNQVQGKTNSIKYHHGSDQYTSVIYSSKENQQSNLKTAIGIAEATSIGFVFQSYNLIGHQRHFKRRDCDDTLCFQRERKKRAIEALERKLDWRTIYIRNQTKCLGTM